MTRHPQTYIKIGSALLLTIVIILYGLFQARNIIYGPLVEIHTPKNGAALSEPLVSIEGTTKNIVTISLNDDQIFIDEQGKFKEQLLLSYGYNIMTVKAEDRFGREIKKTLELIYK